MTCSRPRFSLETFLDCVVLIASFRAFVFGFLGLDGSGSLTVTWDAPPDCGTAPELEDAILELLPASPSTPVTVAGVVTPTRGGFQVVLTIASADPSVERRLQAETCRALLDAAALVAAVATNPEGFFEAPAPLVTTPAPEPCPKPAPPELLPAEPPPEQPSSAAPRPPRRPRWSLAAEGGLSTHLLTPLTWAIGGRLQWIHGAWRIDLGVHHDFGQRVIVEQRLETRIHLTRGSLSGCWAHRAGRWEVPLCVGTSLGSIVAQPISGLLHPDRAPLFWGAADVSIGTTVLFETGLALYVRADVLAPFVRPGLAIAAGGDRLETYRAPAVGGTLAFGVAFRTMDRRGYEGAARGRARARVMAVGARSSSREGFRPPKDP